MGSVRTSLPARLAVLVRPHLWSGLFHSAGHRHCFTGRLTELSNLRHRFNRKKLDTTRPFVRLSGMLLLTLTVCYVVAAMLGVI